MEEIIDPEEEAKRSRFRWWWIITGLFVLTVVIFGYLMFIYDVAPPDDAWLLPKPFPPASGPHSIPEFVQRVDKLIETEKQERMKLPEDVRSVTAAEAQKARAFVDKHHVILDELDQFLQANRGPLPFPDGSDNLNVGSHVQYLTDFQEAANLAAMKAKVLAREGKGREAIEQSLALMRLGGQLASEGSFLIQWLVGITVQAIAIGALENAAHQHPWDLQDLELVEKGFRDSEIPLANFRFALQGEYLSFKHTVLQAYADIQARPFSFSHSEEWPQRTLKPNMTCVRMMSQLKPLYEAFGKDGPACLSAGLENGRAYEELNQHRFRLYFSANFMGNVLTQLGATYEKICEKNVRLMAYYRLVDTMVVLRRFELEQGALPGKLEQLCPKYLPAVPPDPYDNQPMRWISTAKALYSVGRDLKDDGGSFSKDFPRSEDKDVGMIYWWASASK